MHPSISRCGVLTPIKFFEFAGSLVCAFVTCSGDWGVAVEGFEWDLFSISSSLTAQSGTAFILEIASVLEAYGEAVPTNLTLAFSTLPSYTVVLEDISFVGPFRGCSSPPQIANTLDTWTCPTSPIGESCTVVCADGYEWPSSVGVVCLTKDSYLDVAADCVVEGSTTTSYRVGQFDLLLTPLNATGDATAFLPSGFMTTSPTSKQHLRTCLV